MRSYDYKNLIKGDLAMFNLTRKIFQWGLDRDLYKYSTVPTQLCKFTEELFEYEDALTEKEASDAIGDMMVVALNMYGVENYKEGSDAESLSNKFREDFFDLGYEKTNVGFTTLYRSIHKQIIRNKATSLHLVQLLFSQFGQDRIDACLSEAYEEIKDRKGRLTPDGNFVKEEDR